MSVSRLLPFSVFVTFTQTESRWAEKPLCLRGCPFKWPDAGTRPSSAGAASLSPPPSRGAKCRCYCGVEPCGSTSERWEDVPRPQALDWSSIQALADSLQGILDHAEAKRLGSHSAKLASHLKKLEKRLERNMPSAGALLGETLAGIVQHQVIYQNFSITMKAMRKEMKKLNLLLQQHQARLLQESTKVTVKSNQIKPSLLKGDTPKDAVHKHPDPLPPAPAMSTTRSRALTSRQPVSSLKAVALRPLDNERNIIREDVCDGTPVRIGDPKTHSSYGRAEGAWLKDPVVNRERVYVASYFFGTTLIEFHSMEHFKLGRWVNSYKLQDSWMGTGHAVYNGSFYYNKAYTRSIIRYDLGKRVAAGWAALDDLAIGSNALAGWKGYSEVVFMADVGGLWVTYFSNDFGYLPEEILVLSRLDPVELATRKETTWKTRVRRPSYANSFLICGVFYVMDMQRQREGTITYALDTYTGFESNPGLRIQSEYSLLTQLDYNPADKLLYAWDNGHQVTYHVRFAF